MDQPATFQSIILTLERFWAEHGCLIWQPYYAQVGAGTMNPATFLRVLGPEPWRVAYVEPSVRPDDGRYGENPNRFQQHYQYQVVLKPDPGNPQELYLQSLEALGINPREHDIRFVEDNWESPALAAWGLGWEVWLDGQEITQFTYFQQAGGQTLDPVSVEITYGLERILIALRNAGGIWDLPWTGGIAYGDVLRQGEWEHSKYYFEVADVERMRRAFEIFEAEAEAALAAGLVLPAHDHVLKCSHTFNVLDTRGAIGVTERAGYFNRMRDLSRRVAEAYVAQRQRLEYPFLKDESPASPSATPPRPSTAHLQRPATSDQSPITNHQSPFLLEIGTEELPAADLDSALAQLSDLVPAMLKEQRLDHDSLRLSGTPRRLVVQVEGLAGSQADRESVVKGPPAARAFDSFGQPTPAAIGFARGKGVPVEALERRAMDGGEYVVAVVREAGRPALRALSDALPGVVAAIKFEKSMRWRPGLAVAFSRPIRWLVALLGDRAVPFEYAGLVAGRATRGLRPMGSPEIEIADAAQYEAVMREQGIVLDPADRAERIAEMVAREAAAVGGEPHYGPELLAEVKNLVERPTPVRGEFDREFLSLPREVLEAVMKKHQRYFPVVAPHLGERTLLPYFVAIRNGDAEHLDVVREGNEHVLRARFADADYFVREDVKRPLAAYRPKLAGLTFQAKLGSMLDKSERIEKLAAVVAPMLGLDAEATAAAARAAHLAKADLATHMVVEMTALQGVMGRVYALRSGESPAVARAIEEQYVASGAVGLPGAAVGLADRLDSLAGLFAAGLAPTGAKDPFALRRAALGVVAVLVEKDLDFDLRRALQAAAGLLPIPAGDDAVAQCLEFLAGRLRGLLIDSGYRYDVVDAVLAQRAHNPAAARRAAAELSAWVAKPDWPQILAAYARCVRITREFKETFALDPDRLSAPSERALFEAYQSVAQAVESARGVNEFFAAFTPIIPVVSRFFEDVLVMHDDPDVRRNRLGLLQRIARLTHGIADLSKLEGF